MSLHDGTMLLIIGTGFIWLGWDIFVYTKVGNIATESWTIWKWSYRMPAIAFLFGLAMGHFFFSMTTPEVLSLPTTIPCQAVTK